MYMASYFSFFGICLLMGAFACHLTAVTRMRPVRAITTVVFAALIFAGTLRVSAWNEAEVASKVYSHAKWEFFDDFLSSALFRELPAGSIIYAPSLATRTCCIAGSYLGYWRDYVHYKTGRKDQHPYRERGNGRRAFVTRRFHPRPVTTSSIPRIMPGPKHASSLLLL